MYFKKFLFFISFLIISVYTIIASEPSSSYKLYGFVRSDIYLNTRKNYEAIDGLFNIHPLPKDTTSAGIDKNATPNSEMLSVASRLGIDFIGTEILGAKSAAKIECDFGGVSSNYYLLRLRQAYLKLNWQKTELLVGQTWHPMFANLSPITPSLSVGSPFQPFNRSPQIHLKQNLNSNFSVLSAVSYQMQYMSQGPIGSSASYMKNGLLPSLHVGIDFKNSNWNTGIGLDGKSLKINHERLNSASAVIYAQYANKKFQVRAKSVLGQNMSEYLMIGGYGVSGINSTSGEAIYTNLNTSSSWISMAYGTKVQLGVYGGYIQNLGSNKNLLASSTGKFTSYGYGYYQDNQLLMDNLYRVATNITYNLTNFRLGFEYELTTAKYGKILATGRVSNPYSVSNHRVAASISYIF